MLVFPNAKINIGLNILEKRNDGFHNIETLMMPVALTDEIEIKKNKKNNKGEIILTTSGITIDGDLQNNLVSQAYRCLHKDFDLPPVNLHLHKKIPIGGGLGGGSADAAFTLKALNDLFELKLTDNQLESYAAQLGSDCAFFIKNESAIATGRGEKLEPFAVNLERYFLTIVIPNIAINTKEAYSKVKPQTPLKSLKQQLLLPIEEWQEVIKNDFEKSVFLQKPTIEQVKKDLQKAGAVYSSLSGSGAAVFALFDKAPELDKLFDKSYVVKTLIF